MIVLIQRFDDQIKITGRTQKNMMILHSVIEYRQAKKVSLREKWGELKIFPIMESLL